EQSIIKFKCFPGIPCFNACCKRADITLTPYDIIRLKQRLKLNSEELLQRYTVPFQMDSDGVPGLKMRTTDEGACLLLDNENGCSIYTDRPIVCRYYPLALLNLRPQDTTEAQEFYSLVQEDHCQGHLETKTSNIAEYRQEQGCAEYDLHNRDWYRLILKKRSAGPGVGRPSEMSLQMFFMASYNLDMFLRFVLSDNFRRNYKLSDNFYDTIAQDELTLLKFALQFLHQVLFGERSIEEVEHVWEQRVEERREVWAMRTKAMQEQHKPKDL
ncbi:50S rRNA methyltransferase, partial [Achromatium sp. WMS1]